MSCWISNFSWLSPQVSPVPSKLKLYHLAYQPCHPVFCCPQVSQRCLLSLQVVGVNVEHYWLQYDPESILDSSSKLEVQDTDYYSAWKLSGLLGFNSLFVQPILCQLTNKNVAGVIKNLHCRSFSRISIPLAFFQSLGWLCLSLPLSNRAAFSLNLLFATSTLEARRAEFTLLLHHSSAVWWQTSHIEDFSYLTTNID